SFSTKLLSAGSHTLLASYSGDGNFTASIAQGLSQAVLRAETSVVITRSRNFAITGRPVTFTATVSVVSPGLGNPGGTVTFLDGNTFIGTSTLVGNVATLTSSFTVGTHAISATYGGDGNFNQGSSTNPAVVTVGTLNQAFVAQVYIDLLHRQVDAAGLAGWIKQLDAGISRPSIV